MGNLRQVIGVARTNRALVNGCPHMFGEHGEWPQQPREACPRLTEGNAQLVIGPIRILRENAKGDCHPIRRRISAKQYALVPAFEKYVCSRRYVSVTEKNFD